MLAPHFFFGPAVTPNFFNSRIATVHTKYEKFGIFSKWYIKFLFGIFLLEALNKTLNQISCFIAQRRQRKYVVLKLYKQRFGDFS